MEQMRLDLDTLETRAVRIREKIDKADYNAFVEKFQPKKTTDDCYTPETVYDAVANWVADTYRLDRATFLRPFYPGGDYEREAYPEGCAVVDNPPFSILARIKRFYCRHGIPFFLFCPTLTMFSAQDPPEVCYLPTGVQITYANGAVVQTSFVTNMEPRARIRTYPSLYNAVKRADDRNRAENRRELPKYAYPPDVLTSAACYQFAQHGVEFQVDRDSCYFIRTMDSQERAGKAAFGGAYLLSRSAAAERSAAERAAAHRWELSERERRIQDTLK